MIIYQFFHKLMVKYSRACSAIFTLKKPVVTMHLMYAFITIIIIANYTYMLFLIFDTLFTLTTFSRRFHLLLSQIFYSTVTTFAKLRGISGFNPLDNDSSYDNSCNGIIDNIARYVWFNGILM